MKCIALATRFSSQAINWHIPAKNSTYAFFARQALSTLEQDLKTQITELCDTLEYGENIKFQQNIYFVHIQKLNDDCCAVICDVELNKSQMRYLSLYLLCNKIPLSNIAANLEYYTQDYKTLEISTNLTEVLDKMKENLEKALVRDIKIRELTDKAENLEKNAVKFKRTVDEHTSSCWPKMCTIS